jgi:aminopeptidase-like protein|tara:strand:- start:1170 stop:2630 length:1461 start_codon:yes stop_codon:yes gene_type:complete
MKNHILSDIDGNNLINDADNLLKELFPICRSITGNGVRQTLSILKKVADFNIKEIPSGTKCYDWTVPNEWNIVDAYVEDSSGRKIIDFKKNNLHLVSYSEPVDKTLSYQELIKHLHTLPDLPDAIPYRTSYYNKNWGFCLSHNDFQKLDETEQYHVKIDSTLEPGNLTYGDFFIKGNSGKEFLFSTYCCHPSLGNDNLSGMVLWILLLRSLQKEIPTHSYRFIIVPETIGAIAYLSQNETEMKKITGGFILTCVAGPNNFEYKRSYLGNNLIDKAVDDSFNDLGLSYTKYPFDINGSDETHFSAPYFRIPIGTVCKDKYYEFDYYHTSLDNLDFINAKNLIKSLKVNFSIINHLEDLNMVDMDNISRKLTHNNESKNDVFYRSLNPYCEPMLSKRGLHPTIGGKIKQKAFNFKTNHIQRNYTAFDEVHNHTGSEIDAIGWLMFYGDGITSVKEISKKSKLELSLLENIAEKLVGHKLLEKIEASNI